MPSELKYSKLFQVQIPVHGLHLILSQEVKKVINKQNRINRRGNKKQAIQINTYKNYRLLIRLRQWHLKEQAGSLMEVRYAREPRNPE